MLCTPRDMIRRCGREAVERSLPRKDDGTIHKTASLELMVQACRQASHTIETNLGGEVPEDMADAARERAIALAMGKLRLATDGDMRGDVRDGFRGELDWLREARRRVRRRRVRAERAAREAGPEAEASDADVIDEEE